jgi:hypothetical protein
LTLCHEHEGANSHINEVNASGCEVRQEHEEVSVIEMADTVVNPGAVLTMSGERMLAFGMGLLNGDCLIYPTETYVIVFQNAFFADAAVVCPLGLREMACGDTDKNNNR